MVRRQSSSVSSSSVLEHVDAPVRDDDVADNLLVAGVIRDVETIGIRLATGGLELGGDRGDRFAIAFEQDHSRTFRGHLERYRPAQSLAGAADETNPVVQQTHLFIPLGKSSHPVDLSPECWTLI